MKTHIWGVSNYRIMQASYSWALIISYSIKSRKVLITFHIIFYFSPNINVILTVNLKNLI